MVKIDEAMKQRLKNALAGFREIDTEECKRKGYSVKYDESALYSEIHVTFPISLSLFPKGVYRSTVFDCTSERELSVISGYGRSPRPSPVVSYQTDGGFKFGRIINVMADDDIERLEKFAADMPKWK